MIYKEQAKRLKSYILGNKESYNLNPQDPNFDMKLKKAGEYYENMFSKPENYKSPIEKPYNYEEYIKIQDSKNPSSNQPQTQEKRSEGQPDYKQMFASLYRPETDVLFKPENNITEDEIAAARKFAYYDNKDPHLGKLLNNKISSWYSKVYGDTPVRQDAAGRNIAPMASVIPVKAPEVKTGDGLSLPRVLERLSNRLTEIDTQKTPEKGVAVLQKALNRKGINPQLKEDGVLGEKTNLQTRLFLADKGWKSLEEALNELLSVSSPA